MTTFAVWAPEADRVEVVLTGSRHPMSADPTRAGWWRADLDVDPHGTDHSFSLDGGAALPDPRALWLPNGVHGPSRTYDHGRHLWGDRGWTGPAGPPVLYELHVGTFTPGGTFASAVERLDHLVDLGVTHVELLPVVAFDGPRGWGYDGVALYAVHEPYGGPDGCKAFVDACHQRGLGVVFDVVYNHLGPSGAYLGRFGPYFTGHHRTPWGDAVNLDGAGSDEVRAFVLDNVRSWIVDFHADGLRLDAVHELYDGRARTLVEEVATLGHQLGEQLGRRVLVTAESDRNDPGLVADVGAGGLGFDGVWDDDVHHALHALLSGERQGYYGDFGSLSTLAKAWADVYVHDGCWSTFRGRHHGRPVPPSIPADRFVVCLQNHDQIGNRAAGDRLAHTVDPALVEIGAALLLTSPFTPMLFMGEEWAASTPWPFFTSFPDPDLADAVRTGRRAEFATHGWTAEQVPDPQADATFASAVLRWDELDQEPHRRMHDWYRRLLALRRQHPELVGRRAGAIDLAVDETARTVVLHLAPLVVAANLAPEPVEVDLGHHLDSPVLALANDDGVEVDGDRIQLPARSVAILAPGPTAPT